MLGHVGSGEVTLFQVKSGNVSLGPVRSC